MLKKQMSKKKIYHSQCGLVQKKKPIFTTPDDLLQDVVLPGFVGLEVLILLGSSWEAEAGRSLSL